MGYSRKNGTSLIYFYENFPFFYFTSGNSRQKAQPLDIPQNCDPLEIPRPKTQKDASGSSTGNSTFFLGHPGNSTSF